MNSACHGVSARAPTSAAVAGPRSLTRLLAVFEALAKAGDGLTFGELRRALDSPRSSLATLLHPLVKDGYLIYDTRLYRLGPAIFRIASRIVSVWDFARVIRPYLQELAERSRESVFIGVLDRAGKAITYVDSLEGPQVIRSSVPVGTIRPLYCTAAGRVLLAFADQQFQEEYLRTTKLEAHTPRTLVKRKALRAELQRVCETGVSVSIGEMFMESAAVSAPVFGVEGKVVAAIAVGAPTPRVLAQLEDLKQAVAEVASRASGIPGGDSGRPHRGMYPPEWPNPAPNRRTAGT